MAGNGAEIIIKKPIKYRSLINTIRKFELPSKNDESQLKILIKGRTDPYIDFRKITLFQPDKWTGDRKVTRKGTIRRVS